MPKSLREMLLKMMAGKQKGFNLPTSRAPQSKKAYLNKVDYSGLLGGKGLFSSGSVGQAPMQKLMSGLLKRIIPAFQGYIINDNQRVGQEEYNKFMLEQAAAWEEEQRYMKENGTQNPSLPGTYELWTDWEEGGYNPFGDNPEDWQSSVDDDVPPNVGHGWGGMGGG